MGGVEISGMKIMKSLPVLNKQVSQPPDSARGDNNSYYHKQLVSPDIQDMPGDQIPSFIQ